MGRDWKGGVGGLDCEGGTWRPSCYYLYGIESMLQAISMKLLIAQPTYVSPRGRSLGELPEGHGSCE